MTFVQNTTPTLPKQPQNGAVQIANSDAQAQKTVYTGGANGSIVRSLIATSTDTSARDVQISKTNGGTSFPIGTVSVPAGAGNTSGVVSTNLLDPTVLKGLAYDDNANPYIILISGDTLTVSALTTVTSGKTITVAAMVVDDF